ncbi:twin-arginine translocase TatA/TatE family subunit [uncultured Albimonas sp.]|uniref:twin-arginine translocase TatA/TatE family subunit n=1 Tax=uncultured Albimonas sp. TaxID=1331701 RepID=UPI0030EF8C85|tara:strand:- start:1244 stop:1471 length:228 start_codon:yes stop_codon:yes gene_type:complete
MAPSIWQILIVAVLVVLLFGRGKISGVMGDVAKGIKSFKKGMQDDDSTSTTANKRVGDPGDDAVDVTPSGEKKDA